VGWARLLEVPGLWVGLLVTVGAWGLTPGGLLPAPEARQGEIALRDYTAPADLLIPDEETTEDKQRRARQEVPPVYDLDTGAVLTLEREVAALFAAGRQLDSREGEISATDLTVALARASGLRVSRPQAEALSLEGFAGDLEDRVRALASRALRRGLVEGKSRLLENRVGGITLRDLRTEEERSHFDLFDHLEYPGELRAFLESEIEDWRDLSGDQRQQVVELLVANLPVNLSPNRSETLERQEAAAARVAPTFKQIRKGQMIVRQGDQIGPAEARLIAEATGSDRASGRLLPLVGTMSLLGLAALVLWPGLAGERVANHSRRSTASAPSSAACWWRRWAASWCRSSSRLLGITTDIKLVELANTNLPLLRRLAFEAPGTFQHSLMVANLAKEGCEAIGADAGPRLHRRPLPRRRQGVPARVLRREPAPGQNPHDKLAPSMSALVLINHVKDGLELARRAPPAAPIATPSSSTTARG
jgi:membrane-associated HD superfamily phosphohydrolase